jgi:hypothetical protein
VEFRAPLPASIQWEQPQLWNEIMFRVFVGDPGPSPSSFVGGPCAVAHWHGT